MEDWVARALAKWPNVPALYGWLSLTRRGVWCIKGEPITRPQIIDTIAANYAADERGCWHFQNGPQRGYMSLEYAPLILKSTADGEGLMTHTGLRVQGVKAVYLDEEGSLLLHTTEGAGLLDGSELGWALDRLFEGDALATEAALLTALALPSGEPTALQWRWAGQALPVLRLDAVAAPGTLGFVRLPEA